GDAGHPGGGVRCGGTAPPARPAPARPAAPLVRPRPGPVCPAVPHRHREHPGHRIRRRPGRVPRDGHRTAPRPPATGAGGARRHQLALVLEPADADHLFAMWTSTVEYRAARTSTDRLDQADFQAERAVTVASDEVTGEQTLTYRGVATAAEAARLTAAHP